MGKREFARLVNEANKQLDEVYGPTSALAKGLKWAPYISVGVDALLGAYDNFKNGESSQEILTDIVTDAGVGVLGALLSSAASGAAIGLASGSVAPGVGNLIGAGVGIVVGIGYYVTTELVEIKGKSIVEWIDSWW